MDWLSAAIAMALQEGRGLAVGKLGTCEAETMYARVHAAPSGSRQAMLRNAGVWPESALPAWATHMATTVLPAMDHVVAWYNPMHEQTAFNAYAPQAEVHQGLHWFNPWEVPWTHLLPAGTRVAVVSPFAESISLQIPHLNSLFSEPLWNNPVILPIRTGCSPALDTTSIAAWPVDVLAGGWRLAVERIVGEVLESRARVALVGCGGLSLPIVAALKRQGIIAIHLGGAVQVLFGIRGRRWIADKDIGPRMASPLWRDPLPSETPRNARAIEGGCYWINV